MVSHIYGSINLIDDQKLETIYTMVDNRFDTVIRKLDLVEQIAMNNQAKLDRVNNSAY